MPASFIKPIKVPEWNSGAANRTEPLAAKKILGHAFAVIPSSAEENWRANLVQTWMEWFDERMFDGASTDENDFDLSDPGNAEPMIRLGGNKISLVPENAGLDPRIDFDANDYVEYARIGNRWTWKISGTDEMYLDALGVWVPGGGLSVGSNTSAPQANRVTAAKTGVSNAVSIDAQNSLVGKVLFGNGSDDTSIRVTYSTDVYEFYCNTVLSWFCSAASVNFVAGVSIGSGVAPAFAEDLRVQGGINVAGAVNPTSGNGIFAGGLSVGHDTQPVADSVTVGTANFGLDFTTANPELRVNGALNTIRWNTANTRFDFMIAGITKMSVRPLEVEIPDVPLSVYNTRILSAQTLPSVDRFEQHRTNTITARGNVLSGGGVSGNHYNVSVATRVSAGVYEITHDINLSNTANEANGVATSNTTLNHNCACRYLEAPDNFTEVRTFLASSGAPTDSSFTFCMWM